MSPALTPAVIGLLGVCIGGEIIRELSFKAAADRAQPARNYALALARNPLLWLGLTVWTLEVVSWVLVLRRAPLAVAYPIATLTYAGIPIASALVLKERLSRSQVLGAALVAAGVVCVGLSGSQP